MSFIRYQLDLVRSPKETIERLTREPGSALVGFKNILLAACLYDFSMVLWWMGNAKVTAPPFLRIPSEQYYFYEIFFFIPVFIAAWLLAAGIIYLLAKASGSTGSYDALLGCLGVAVAVCAYITLIPDLFQGFLFSTGLVPQDQYVAVTGRGFPLVVVLAYMLGYLVSNIISFAAITHYTQGLSKFRSAVWGLLGFAGFFALFFTYIR